MQIDNAETANMQRLLSRIGAGLDQFLKFEHKDALRSDANWCKYLDIALPQQGVGIEQIVDDLLTQVIPNGSAIPKPGFSSYITTGATSVAALALVAASIASPQRYSLTAFNLLEDLSLRWLASMFHLEGMQGIYSSGGSVANLLALGAARHPPLRSLDMTLGPMGLQGRCAFMRALRRITPYSDPAVCWGWDVVRCM